MIAVGWGFAVAIRVCVPRWASGGYIHPAVTLARAAIGEMPMDEVPVHPASRFIRGFLGAVGAWPGLSASLEGDE